MPKRMGRGPLAYKKTQQIQQEDEILLINEKNKVSMLREEKIPLYYKEKFLGAGNDLVLDLGGDYNYSLNYAFVICTCPYYV